MDNDLISILEATSICGSMINDYLDENTDKLSTLALGILYDLYECIKDLQEHVTSPLFKEVK